MSFFIKLKKKKLYVWCKGKFSQSKNLKTFLKEFLVVENNPFALKSNINIWRIIL